MTDRHKSHAEAKVERITWFALVLVFAVLQIIPAETTPNFVVPLLGAIILFASGVYQYTRKWTVSPVTWVAGAFLLVAAGYSYLMNPKVDMLGISMLIFAVVIGFGVLTGET